MKKNEWQKKSQRSFAIAILSGAIAVTGTIMVFNAELDNGIPWPFRKVLQFNERIWQTLYSNKNIGENPPAPPSGEEPRVNGNVGLKGEIATEKWKLIVSPSDNLNDAHNVQLSLDALRKMPQTSATSVFKCVEGWSEPIAYKGVRFSDFLEQIHIAEVAKTFAYVGLETPDGEYYVSLDMASMLHPKTTLALEMNGEPLSHENGAPLRLIVPTKYGIKNLKRIGRIFFSNERPRDYWAERGYDWYAGL